MPQAGTELKLHKEDHKSDKMKNSAQKKSRWFPDGIKAAEWWMILLTAVTALASCLAIGNSLNEQRPWVAISAINMTNGSRSVVLSIKNGGKSPAFHVRAHIYGGIVGGHTSFEQTACANDCTFTDITLLPDVPFGARVPKLEEKSAGPTDSLWLFVRVDYRDGLNFFHTTQVCLVQSPLGDINSCDGVPSINS